MVSESLVINDHIRLHDKVITVDLSISNGSAAVLISLQGPI